MAALSAVPSMEDLKIKFQESSLIFPYKETPKKSIFLSNIDQILNYDIPTAHFFKANPDFPPEIMAKRLKIALEKVLVPYDFMAGRLKLNRELGRLEINCNAAGAGFVVAKSDVSLDEIGDENLVCPNLGYRQLAVQRLDSLPPEVDQPLCVFQVTSFKCGGFAIGMSTNHILFDGLGAKVFLLNLASQSFENKPLAIVPYNDRRILCARSPPHVSYPHREFLKFDLPVGLGSTPPNFDCIIEELDFKIVKLTTTQISNLKDNITKTSKIDKISTFAVVAALIWRCKAFSDDKNKVSTLLNAIDIRPIVNPPLPYSYSANAVLPLGVSETCEEIKNGPFSKLVEIITEGAKEMTHEYVKSAFDWLELNRGIPHGDYFKVSSWLRLGFDEVEYAWGKPIYSCPVVNHRKDICWVFRDAVDGGVSAMVALPSQEMDIFEAVFHDFIASILVHL
ncbi:hypothetical protein ABFS82_07G106800 [Erythranthe guttata]|uniref:Omega-hydroxypalmitate O-feruloyl transferase n=1 Tax=Erythranthe guttata TaxID=4155 RepID=A0A022PQ65_ERYGU|nr:PREDICTED: omega-hydroxypalmitate O-feruloyl transferase-like [Erythranthe guttata]EYU17599.1 hypothetical protein MIMGU_mgv1a006131mg [Erythranthe guttata]|eukprot:XP_012829424.1 PREDICTED: omega-hydroxypalmitate O-feruloyl transferase-like [Erythranthe guttata]